MARDNIPELELARVRITELEAQVATLTVATVNSSKPRARVRAEEGAEDESPRCFLVCLVLIAVGAMIVMWASNAANYKPKCCDSDSACDSACQ